MICVVINKYSFIFSIKIIKMKNKILSGFAALSIAAIAVFNLGLVSKSSNLSDVSLANVEALAEQANGGLADDEGISGTLYPGKADDFDDANHCVRQCVLNGSGCFYINNLSNNC
jgi:hypothetical protein